MSPEEITRNREAFESCCHQYIQRNGIDALLEYLKTKTDFFEAPSSTSFHLNEPGGLCRHSLNVFETLLTLYTSLVEPRIEDGTSPFADTVSTESIAVVALFHDVCKANTYRPTERWKKDANGRWMSYPGYEVNDSFPFGHGEKSCVVIHWFLPLRQEELLAIRWHMGAWGINLNSFEDTKSYDVANKQYPLVGIIQCADNIAANIMERTGAELDEY